MDSFLFRLFDTVWEAICGAFRIRRCNKRSDD